MRRAALAICAPMVLAACAGPTTPFGAISSYAPIVIPLPEPPHQKPRPPAVHADVRAPSIDFHPPRQVLHERTQLRVGIEDPLGVPNGYVVKFFYNGVDLSSTLARSTRRSTLLSATRIEYLVPDLRLLPTKFHQVELRYYRRPGVLSAIARLEPPACDPFKRARVKNTGPFRPPTTWMKTIQTVSTMEGVNPNLLTGLIAQESAFNPQAISWAKALGLTQVTPLADSDLEKYHADWPRSPQVDEVSVPRLKAMILTGHLGPSEDWRLDPGLSIRGGLTYLTILNKYWRQENNFLRVKQTFEQSEEALTEIILASYNSGPSRVSKALRELGPWYLSSPELGEARRYVSRVMSYCDQFENEALDDENQT